MSKATLSVKCRCNHAFQDATYGKGIRVATLSLKGDASCTVCGSKTYIGTDGVKKGKKSGGKGGAKSYFAFPPADGWKGGVPEQNGLKG